MPNIKKENYNPSVLKLLALGHIYLDFTYRNLFGQHWVPLSKYYYQTAFLILLWRRNTVFYSWPKNESQIKCRRKEREKLLQNSYAGHQFLPVVIFLNFFEWFLRNIFSWDWNILAVKHIQNNAACDALNSNKYKSGNYWYEIRYIYAKPKKVLICHSLKNIWLVVSPYSLHLLEWRLI